MNAIFEYIVNLIKLFIIIAIIGGIGEIIFKFTGKEILSDKRGSYSYPLAAITLILFFILLALF